MHRLAMDRYQSRQVIVNDPSHRDIDSVSWRISRGESTIQLSELVNPTRRPRSLPSFATYRDPPISRSRGKARSTRDRGSRPVLRLKNSNRVGFAARLFPLLPALRNACERHSPLFRPSSLIALMRREILEARSFARDRVSIYPARSINHSVRATRHANLAPPRADRLILSLSVSVNRVCFAFAFT